MALMEHRHALENRLRLEQEQKASFLTSAMNVLSNKIKIH